MKALSAILSTILFCSSTFVNSQDQKENIFIHPSSTVLITGETLYFSAYSVSQATNNLSSLSKVLYIELIGENGVEYQGKVALKNGRGYGDFFINSTLKSGTYQLVAYTRWMRNFEDYSQTEIIIINPFKEPDQKIYSESRNQNSKRVVNVTNEKQNYEPRTVVKLSETLPEGTYSASVRKKMITSSPVKDWKLQQSEWAKSGSSGQIKFLPEVREGLIDGRLIDASGKPAPNKHVMLSIPGEIYQVRITETNDQGRFTAPHENSENDKAAFLIPLDLDSSYSIEMDDIFLKNPPEFDYNLPKLDSLQIVEIIEKSIRVQLENSFPNVQTTPRVPPSPKLQIIYDLSFKLDDYTRFKTLKETFTEFIPTANIREKRDPVIKAYFDLGPIKSQASKPLILLDGVFVSATKLVDFNPYEIEKIEILNQRFHMGSFLADGIVSFSTYEHDFGTFILDRNYHKVNLMGVTAGKTYSFRANSNLNYPDQRDQLHWDPLINIGSDQIMELEFFTSDVTGVFEIVIKGLSNQGEVISVSKEFRVSKAGM